MENSGDFIEKMLELGIGMSMIQQVPEMMKGILPSSMAAPQQAPPAPLSSSEMQVYLVVDQTQAGPFSETELIKLIKNDLLKPETLVWKAGMVHWTVAAQVPEVNKMFVLAKL